LLLNACAAPSPRSGEALGGTSWQLVRFKGGDDTILTPDDRAKYTIAFASDGGVSVRLDCNRGRAVRAARAHARAVSAGIAARPHCQALAVRALIHDEGRPPFLSLMADGGIYELEPIP
jgi:para-nitrobenzyl esterase